MTMVERENIILKYFKFITQTQYEPLIFENDARIIDALSTHTVFGVSHQFNLIDS